MIIHEKIRKEKVKKRVEDGYNKHNKHDVHINLIATIYIFEGVHI